MKKYEAPAKLGEKLSATLNKYKVRITKDKEVASVISASPKKYASTIAGVQCDKENAGDKLTAEGLIDAMTKQWRIKKGSNANKEDDYESGDETIPVLSMVNFNGKCFKCGKDGHMKINCPMLKNGKTCKHCGKLGHDDDVCFTLEKNKHKRPEWWNDSKTEAGALCTEVLL